jgi:hypothetical protein
MLNDDERVNEICLKITGFLSDYPLEWSENILARCYLQAKHRNLIEKLAEEMKLELYGFLTNKALELYYDIKWQESDIAFISKGWTDPGFRLGQIIRLSENELEQVKTSSLDFISFCSTQGVAVSGRIRDGAYSLELLDNLYLEGFNRATFAGTLESIGKCVTQLRKIVGK